MKVELRNQHLTISRSLKYWLIRTKIWTKSQDGQTLSLLIHLPISCAICADNTKLVPSALITLNSSGTKGFGTHTKHRGRGGGVRKGPTQYLKNGKRYEPDTLGRVRGILQGLKKFQVGMTVFAW